MRRLISGKQLLLWALTIASPAFAESNLGNLNLDCAKAVQGGDVVKATEICLIAVQAGQRLALETLQYAASLNNLGALYYQQGKYDKSADMFEQALPVLEKVTGSNSQNMAAALNNLASVYRQQDLLTKAEPLYRQALPIWQKEVGPNSPPVAATLNNLAKIYSQQGDYAKAESFYKETVTVLEKMTDPNSAAMKEARSMLLNMQQKLK